MRVNRGKQFEDQIKKAVLKNNNVSFDRFPDPMAGYAGIRNICDFSMYAFPYQYYIECKSLTGNTLNFDSMITKDQWSGLLEKSEVPGVIAGLMVWYIDHDVTVFTPIQELKRIRDKGAKSLNIKHLADGEPIDESQVFNFKIAGRKKRILFEYDITSFLSESSRWAAQKWGKEVSESWQRFLNQH